MKKTNLKIKIEINCFSLLLNIGFNFYSFVYKPVIINNLIYILAFKTNIKKNHHLNEYINFNKKKKINM